MVTEVKGHVIKGQMYILCALLCQKLLLNGWTDFLQTWWGDALGWELVSRTPPELKVKVQRSKVK